MIVNHAIAVLAEIGEANVKPHDEHQEREEDEQLEWLMPH